MTAGYVGWFLLICATGFYGYGIIEAICVSLKYKGNIPDDAYSPVLASFMSTIQGLLLTNLGALLGISVKDPNSPVARNMMLQKPVAQNSLVNTVGNPLQLREKIQLLALVMYVISLVACVITWAVEGFSSDSKEVVPVVSESGKVFVAVVLAYLTMILGVQSTNNSNPNSNNPNPNPNNPNPNPNNPDPNNPNNTKPDAR